MRIVSNPLEFEWGQYICFATIVISICKGNSSIYSLAVWAYFVHAASKSLENQSVL